VDNGAPLPENPLCRLLRDPLLGACLSIIQLFPRPPPAKCWCYDWILYRGPAGFSNPFLQLPPGTNPTTDNPFWAGLSSVNPGQTP